MSNQNKQTNLNAWLGLSDRPSPTTAQDEPESQSQSQSQQEDPDEESQEASNSHEETWKERKARLRDTSRETIAVLPGILQFLPHLDPSSSTAYSLQSLPSLDPKYCPKFPPTAIEIHPADSFNAAIDLSTAPNTSGVNRPGNGRVAVLNMASHSSPGGGWRNGAMAQEEALCYRSSLHMSLHRDHYPWTQKMGLYTPDVVIIRSDMASGHMLWSPTVPPQNLPVVSVLSIAAIRRPRVKRIVLNTPRSRDEEVIKKEVFVNDADRNLTKDKMRICLRMAAIHGHRRLVLGALGCGAFRNPKQEVADCWAEVFQESEFQGGWWERVVFAVFDRRGEGNLEVFEETLSGIQV